MNWDFLPAGVFPCRILMRSREAQESWTVTEVSGKGWVTGGRLVLSYTIPDEEGEPLVTELFCESREVLYLNQQGGGRSCEMAFVLGETARWRYAFSFGEMSLLVHTGRMQIERRNERVQIALSYYIFQDASAEKNRDGLLRELIFEIEAETVV